MLNLPIPKIKTSTSQISQAATQTPRFTSIPKTYLESNFVPAETINGEVYQGTPSATSKFANLSGFLGGGQYTQDVSQPSTLLKSTRTYTPKVNEQLNWGVLSSGKTEIDHTIPLWIGGTDTPENKIALPLAEHDIKTKQNAVIQALFYANKIDLPEARMEAINWQGKDISGIKLNKNGQVSLATAEKKYKEWKKPTEISMSDVFKTWGKKIGSALTLGAYKGEPSTTDIGEQLYEKSLREGPKNALGQFIQGATSGATLGMVPSEGVQGEPLTQTVARGAGQLVGTLASFMWLGGIVGKIGKAVFGAKTIETAKGIKEVSKLPQWLEKLESTESLFKTGKIAIPKNTAFKAIQSAGLFTLHGQLSKQEQNNFEGRVKRFLSDASFGGLLALPGQTLKGYAGLTAGVYALSALEGATPGEAMLNTAIVVGLHGISGIGYNERIQTMASNAAIKERVKWDIKPPLPGEKMTIERINTENRIAADKIWNTVESPEEAKKAIENLIISGRQLYKGGLGREQRLLEDIKDIKSITQRTNKLTQAQLDMVPENIVTAFDAYGKLFSRIKIEETDISRLKASAPFEKEFFTTTGVASGVNTKTAKDIIDFVDNGGKAGDKVIVHLVTDPKRIEIYSKISEAQSPERQFNPTSVIEVYGESNNKFYSLGKAATERRLTDTTISPETGKPMGIIPSREAWEFPPEKIQKAEINNESLAKWMKERDIDTVSGKINFITSEATVSLEPSVDVEITSTDWAIAPMVKSILAGESSKKISKSIINKPEIISPKIEFTGEKTGTILNTITQQYEGYADSDNFAMVIDSFRKSLVNKNPEQLKQILKEDYGIMTNVRKTKQILDKSNEITVKDYLNFLLNNKASNTLNERGLSMFNLIFSKDSFYSSLPVRDKTFINNLKLLAEGPKPIDYKKTGQIEQKIPLEEIKVTPETNVQQARQVQQAQQIQRGRQTEITEFVKPPEIKKPVKYTELAKIVNKKEKLITKVGQPLEIKQPTVGKQTNIIEQLEKTAVIQPKTAKMQRSIDVDGKTMTENEVRNKFKEAKASGNKKEINKWADLVEKIEREPSLIIKGEIKQLNIPSLDAIKNRINEVKSQNKGALQSDYKKLLDTIQKNIAKKEQTNKEFKNPIVQKQLEDIENSREGIIGAETAEDVLRLDRKSTQVGSLGELESELMPDSLFKDAVENNIISKEKDIYKYGETELGRNTKEAVDYIKNNIDILHQIRSDIMKKTSGWRYPQSDSGYYKINDIFDKVITSLKEKSSNDTWEKHINDKKIKWWTDFIQTISNKDKDFRQRSIPTRLLKDFYQSEVISKGGISFKLNTDNLTWEIEKMIKNKQYHSLPESIKKIVENKISQNKNIKFIVGSTKEYPGFYNLTEDIRKFVIESEGKKEFGRPTFTKDQINKMGETLGISGNKLSEYMSNISSSDIQMPIVHNMLYKAFGPTENLFQLTDKQIKSSAENAAQMVASIIKFKKNN